MRSTSGLSRSATTRSCTARWYSAISNDQRWLASADSDPIGKKLRQVDPGNAPLYLPTVELVEVTVDQATGRLTWETVEEFALARL